MTAETSRCTALTKAGERCKNAAQQGSPYCYIHRNYQPAAEAAETPAPSTVAVDRAELEALVAELNELAQELKRISPEYAPPPYSATGMRHLLTENLERFTPDAVHNLQENLEGLTVEDFKDIETWKGMWFTLNYLIQLEASERKDSILRHLTRLPGVTTLADIRTMLADTPPEEFLKLDTWKGMWFIVNYELRNQAGELHRRVRGESEESV